MSNPIPPGGNQASILAAKLILGLNQYAIQLGILQVTASGMQTVLDVFTASDSAFNTARSALNSAYDDFHPKNDALSAWLLRVRSVLTNSFGNRWTQWAQAGYVNLSTGLPGTITGRLALSQRLIAFFTANPGYEVAALQVTAAEGTTRRAATVAAQQVVADAMTVQKQKFAERATALEALRVQMRLLVKVLDAVLSPDDPRWKAFGLNIPSIGSTPAQPQNVNVAPADQALMTGALLSKARLTAATGVAVLATCDAVPLATRYRWRMRIVGLQSDYTLAASTTEPMAIIATPIGVEMEIIVQAVNTSLQGVPSEPVIYRTAPVEKAAPETAIVSTPAKAVALPHGSHGNGRAHTNGNGNTSHSRAA